MSFLPIGLTTPRHSIVLWWLLHKTEWRPLRTWKLQLTYMYIHLDNQLIYSTKTQPHWAVSRYITPRHSFQITPGHSFLYNEFTNLHMVVRSRLEKKTQRKHNRCQSSGLKPGRSFLCNEFTNLHVVVKRLASLQIFKNPGEGLARQKNPDKKNTISVNHLGSEPRPPSPWVENVTTTPLFSLLPSLSPSLSVCVSVFLSLMFAV